MILTPPVIGRNIALRTSEPDDAEFILALRLDPELSRYLKPVSPDVGAQRRWLEAQRQDPTGYNLTIESRTGERHGAVALYNIAEGRFDWGRWIVARSAPLLVAYESLLLVYRLAFLRLGLRETVFEVRKGNAAVIAHHARYGATPVREDETYRYFRYTREQFVSDKAMIDSPLLVP
jgi:RimJ/RimL family protein N-acetyltransferase